MTVFLLVASVLAAGLIALFLFSRHRVARLRHPGLVWLALAGLVNLGILELARRTLS